MKSIAERSFVRVREMLKDELNHLQPVQVVDVLSMLAGWIDEVSGADEAPEPSLPRKKKK